MSKVLTFSRHFPAYHPKAGQPTFFVEKIWQSIYIGSFEQCTREHFDFSKLYAAGIDIYAHDKYQPKHHTIRAGHRWKAGDWFSPRVWGSDVNQKTGRSGPYHSKQIIIAPDIQVKKVWSFQIDEEGDVFIDDKRRHSNDFQFLESNARLIEVAHNDGLYIEDLRDWLQYPKPFTGQIICWNENINY